MADLKGLFSPPEYFDEYRLLRCIGQGGMGQVYLAHDTVLHRKVAIKFIAATQPDESQRRRFLLEARSIARLQHPNVVAIYRVGSVAGRPYIASEFIEGKSLGPVLAAFPWEQVLRIGIGLARALSAAHRRGILHRDVKPSNAMLTSEGEVKLLDFGVAKLVEPTSEDERRRSSSAELPKLEQQGLLTGPGRIPGTFLYIAPEVLAGEPVTPGSDVYSLGALLYELLTARAARKPRIKPAPLGTTDDSVILPELENSPPILELVPTVDPRLAAVIGRCLQENPALRFASGDAVRDALEQLQAELTPLPMPEGDPYLGLQSFAAAHRGLFHGRGRDIRAILDRLRTEPILLVIGDSGVGKSSLCRAGVLPLISEGRLDPTRTYHVLTMTPGRRPLSNLLGTLSAHVGLPEDALRIMVNAEPAALERTLRRLPKTGTVLFVDQAEELVTLAEEQEVAAFGEVLDLLSASGIGIRVLLALRSDFLTRLQRLIDLGEVMSRALYLLRPLSREETREAIVSPARGHGFAFESSEMIDALIDASISAPGGLPILQFALSELWRARDRSRKLIPAAALRDIGGVAGALTRHADAVLAGLLSRERNAARRILLSLINLDGTRALRSEKELGVEPDTRAALAALVKGRLLVAREIDGDTAYELAHEALAVAWPTLREWLDGAVEQRVVKARISAAAAEWERLGRAPDGLLNQRQLNELATFDIEDLAPLQRAFLRASRSASRRRRIARLTAMAAIGMGLLSIFLWFRWKTAADRERAIAVHVGQAARAESAAKEHRVESAALRAQAFAQLDEDIMKGQPLTPEAQESAERLYSESRQQAQRSEEEYIGASEALETALFLGTENQVVRHLLGEVTYERLLLAEESGNDAHRQELRHRLANYDPTGQLHRQLESNAWLSLRTSPAGASLSIARYEDVRGKLRPGFNLWKDLTPLVQKELPPGSYLLTLELSGHALVRLPLLLRRGERLALALQLPEQSSVPAGYVYIPPGRFLFGSADDEDLRRSFLGAQPLHETLTGGYLIGRTEVTFAQWLEFLRALPKEERAPHLPKESSVHGALELRELPSGKFELMLQPTVFAHRASEGELIHYDGRNIHAVADWRQCPVSAISLDDAQAFLSWLRQSGRLPGARLCDEREWERAARGGDGRIFPQGNRMDPEDSNFDETYGRNPRAFGPDEVGSHPASESPFGLQDMVGNVWEWTRSIRAPEEVILRGGAWYLGQLTCRSTNREPTERSQRSLLIGLRVCATVPPR
jgi:serine/threonine protein kinase/formylglycine-generating enzyme required for sulfatase activity